MLDSQLRPEFTSFEDVQEPTQEFMPFEMIAVNPDAYTKDQILAAFRAANIALGQALIFGGEAATEAEARWGGDSGDVERLGRALAKH